MSESWRFLSARFLESFLLVLIVGAALVWTTQLRRLAWRSWLDRCSRTALSRMGLAAVATMIVALLVQTLAPAPPEIHDEFSNLLLADTLVSGRLSNPTHPLWRHFETFHVLQQPTYASKYPPAMGIALAVGRLLSGSAAIGVCLLHAAAAAAMVWMLEAWTTRRWALCGGLLFALLAPIQVEWARSFMGSGAAVLGACLVLGAAQRLLPRGVRREPRMLDGSLLGLGLVILANSRPFEGFVFGLVTCVWLGLAWVRDSQRSSLRQAARPAGGLLFVLAAGAAALLLYCQAVTGDWTRLPYAEYQAQYGLSPLFVWQPDPEREVEYGNREFANFYQYFEYRFYQQQQSWDTFWRFKSMSLAASLLQLLNPTLWLVMAIAASGWFDRKLRVIWWLLGVQAATSVTVVWLQANYIAPMVAPLFVLLVVGLRRVSVWRRREGQGNAIVVGACLAHAMVLVAAIGFAILQGPPDWAARRQQIEQAMQRSGQKHLVTVVYSAGHNPHMEWVYNGADIDTAPVVWARYLEPASNERLFEYFSDREQWLLLADKQPPELIPLRRETTESSSGL